MSLVPTDEKKVKQLARKMHISVTLYRDVPTLSKFIQWRYDRRSIIVKWNRFPKEVVSIMMRYVGNEYEREFELQEQHVKKTRTKYLTKYKHTEKLWHQFNDTIRFLDEEGLHHRVSQTRQLFVAKRDELQHELNDITTHLSLLSC
jgi:hypothetical protein